MKKMLLIAAVIIVFAGVVVTCTTNKGGAGPAPTPTAPAQTPTPGTDGYWSAVSSGFTFKWKVNGSNLDCKVSAATTGWVAAGLNTQGFMDGANIVLGYVTGGTTAAIADMHGVGHTHPVDTIDNVTNKAGTDDGVTTEITYTIPMTNDANGEDISLTEGNTYWLIMTAGANGDDTLGGSGMPVNRAKFQFQLF
jgi:hypothetical protein